MDANRLRWDGGPGHYEVHYVSLTDRASGVGVWIRYTLLAPLDGPPACALWLLAMDPERPGEHVGRKAAFPAAELQSAAEPFRLTVGGAQLTDRGATGAFDDVAWDLRWEPNGPAHHHVHPLLERARIARTVLVLPHPDLAVQGTVSWADRGIELAGARGGQAHLWGSKHATRWAWLHCNDLGRSGAFVDGVSVVVPRFGRQIGPSTPVVGRFGGRDFASTGPLRVARNPSRFTLTSWEFEARERGRRLVGAVDARREDLVGVTYHDPDGERAYCYNTEVASLRLQVWEGERLVEELEAPRRAHFEYAQREPLADVPLLVT